MARIVIVEDDGALRNDICDRLEDWGHVVFPAASAAKGLDLIEQSQPDLILCDICMPRENGFSLLKQVRAKGSAHAQTPVILISALSDLSATTYADHCGADDYIVKPVSYAELDQKIRHHLKRSNGVAAKLTRMIRAL